MTMPTSRSLPSLPATSARGGTMTLPGRRILRGAAILVVVGGLMSIGTGTAYADTATGTNTTVIAVPAAGSPGQQGPGSPYPSTITVSGLTGVVSDVNV